MGYVKNSLDSEPNFTGFFEYDAATDAEQGKNYNYHKRHTEDVLEWTSMMNPSMLSEFQYKLSDKTKEVDIISFATTAEIGKAINDWSERKLFGKSYTKCK